MPDGQWYVASAGHNINAMPMLPDPTMPKISKIDAAELNKLWEEMKKNRPKKSKEEQGETEKNIPELRPSSTGKIKLPKKGSIFWGSEDKTHDPMDISNRMPVTYTAVKVTGDELKRLKEIDGRLQELEKKHHDAFFILDRNSADSKEYSKLSNERDKILEGKQRIEHKALEGTFKTGDVVKIVNGDWVPPNFYLKSKSTNLDSLIKNKT